MRRGAQGLALAALAASALSVASAAAQGPAGADDSLREDKPAREEKSWREEKCARYGQIWREALTRFGRVGLSEGFVTAHEAFLARGCESPREVCPRSKEELALANVLVLRSMNFGAASTFAPFACAASAPAPR